ncbi:hypothetical protein BGZ68_002735 [Mortierella alpina]|nr:hypothetical protein BGZ68_002735 [Mortierella alpina]
MTLSSISEVPVTTERKAFELNVDAVLSTNPNDTINNYQGMTELGIPRANAAATPMSPYGTTKDHWNEKHAHQTVMQQHCFLSYGTQSSLLPDPFFRIYVGRIHKDKHGSSSGTYDPEGRFVPQHFEDIFAKYAVDGNQDGLTWNDVMRQLKGQRVTADPYGWIASFFEWFATYLLLWPEDGVMKKDDIRRVFDGSIFYEIADRRQSRAQRLKETRRVTKKSADAKSM